MSCDLQSLVKSFATCVAPSSPAETVLSEVNVAITCCRANDVHWHTCPVPGGTAVPYRSMGPDDGGTGLAAIRRAVEQF